MYTKEELSALEIATTIEQMPTDYTIVKVLLDGQALIDSQVVCRLAGGYTQEEADSIADAYMGARSLSEEDWEYIAIPGESRG